MNDNSTYHAQKPQNALPVHAPTPRLQPQQWHTDRTDIDEAEAIAQMEEQELQELLALAEEEQPANDEMQHIPSSPTRYGSDEEDYDDIFMEIVSSQGLRDREQKQQGDDSMDLS